MTQQPSTTKTAAEARADDLAGFAQALGHTVERVADRAEGVFEVIVRGRFETIQIVVRQSKFPSRSSVWAQRLTHNSDNARRLTAASIKAEISRVTPIPTSDPAAEQAPAAPRPDDRIVFKYLNADHRVHEASGVELLRIGGIWHVKAPGDEPRTGGNPDQMIDNVMPYAHSVVRATLDAATGAGAQLGLVRIRAGRYEADSGVHVDQHPDGTWWAYAPQPGTSAMRLLCAFQTTLAATLPYVAEWLDNLTVKVEQDQADALRMAGVTWARIEPGPDGPAALVIEGERFPVPARHSTGGTMAALRIGETLAAAGYRIDGAAFADVLTDGGAAGETLRVRLVDFEPVLDADGSPVPLPAYSPMHRVDLAMMRQLFAGRVPAPHCPHYIARSERDAGVTTCEKQLCVQVERGRRTGCAETNTDGLHAFVEDPAGLTEGRDVCGKVPDAPVHTRNPDGIPEVWTLGAGDDRQVDQAAAEGCAAVLADARTHGGPVRPFVFSDGPLGEHIEQLCEVHGACTTARPAGPADVERLARPMLTGDRDVAPAPLVELVDPEATSAVLVGANTNGFAVVFPAQLDAGTAAAIGAYGYSGRKERAAVALALAEAYARIHELYVDRPDRTALALALGVLRELGAPVPGDVDQAEPEPAGDVEPVSAREKLAELVEQGAVPGEIAGKTVTPAAATAVTAALAELGFTRPQHTRWEHPAGAEVLLIGLTWNAYVTEADGARRRVGPISLDLGQVLPAVAEWIDEHGGIKINNPAPVGEPELEKIEALNALIETELGALRAAVELHRPALLDKHARPTTDPEAAKWIRCNACHESVPTEGCETWRAAHPQ